jgi:hypothetical protein
MSSVTPTTGLQTTNPFQSFQASIMSCHHPYSNGQANLIAERIKQVLCNRSIVATYHSFGAKADCTTKYHVRFRIRLYRRKGADRDTIIVEIQRLEGFEVMFQKDVFAIFDAAEGWAADHLLDEIEPAFDIADDYDDTYTQSTLDLVTRILFPDNEKADGKQIQITISVLMSATNPSKVGREATRISNILLFSESSTRVRDFIVSNACSFNVEPSSTTQYNRVKHQSLEILTISTINLQMVKKGQMPVHHKDVSDHSCCSSEWPETCSFDDRHLPFFNHLQLND